MPINNYFVLRYIEWKSKTLRLFQNELFKKKTPEYG